MSYTNQFETSFQASDFKNNIAANTDLDDKLINQALSIFQSSQRELRAGGVSRPSDQQNTTDSALQMLDRPCQPTTNGLRNSIDFMKDVLMNEALTGASHGIDKLPPATGRHLHPGDIKSKIAESINRLFDRPHDGPHVLRRNQKCEKVGSELNGDPIPKCLPNEQNRAKDRNQNETQDKHDWEGFYLCSSKIPSKPNLRDQFDKPSDIFLCSYRIPAPDSLPKIERLHPEAPNDIILCSDRLPRSGIKPVPGNYYACVSYYPLRPKDL